MKIRVNKSSKSWVWDQYLSKNMKMGIRLYGTNIFWKHSRFFVSLKPRNFETKKLRNQAPRNFCILFLKLGFSSWRISQAGFLQLAGLYTETDFPWPAKFIRRSSHIICRYFYRLLVCKPIEVLWPLMIYLCGLKYNGNLDLAFFRNRVEMVFQTQKKRSHLFELLVGRFHVYSLFLLFLENRWACNSEG